jgi:hypothetical protein
MPEKTEMLHRQPYQQLTANLTFSHFFPGNCGIAVKPILGRKTATRRLKTVRWTWGFTGAYLKFRKKPKKSRK